jgi:hypothetical protein
MGELQGHTGCPSTLGKFLNVDRTVHTTAYQLTKVDRPGPSTEHVVDEEEEKTEETWPLPARPSCVDTLIGRQLSFGCSTM